MSAECIDMIKKTYLDLVDYIVRIVDRVSLHL